MNCCDSIRRLGVSTDSQLPMGILYLDWGYWSDSKFWELRLFSEENKRGTWQIQMYCWHMFKNLLCSWRRVFIERPLSPMCIAPHEQILLQTLFNNKRIQSVFKSWKKLEYYGQGLKNRFNFMVTGNIAFPITKFLLKYKLRLDCRIGRRIICFEDFFTFCNLIWSLSAAIKVQLYQLEC